MQCVMRIFLNIRFILCINSIRHLEKFYFRDYPYEIQLLFCSLGNVHDVTVFDKAKEQHSKCPKFAFVEFVQRSSVKAALEQNGKIKIGRNVLNIRERLPKCGMEDKGEEDVNDVDFPSLLAKFDWRSPAAKYLFKEEKMEHFLSEFVHALGCSRGIKQESFDCLVGKLVKLSDSIPDNKNEIMPPHLSGMISNITKNKWLDESQLTEFLASSPHLIKIDADNRRVFYLGTPNKSEARDKLRRILIEGLFIYFFAKFCHGPSFKIKPQYYMVVL